MRRSAPLLAPERLEPPPAVGIAAEQVVVVGEREVRKAGGRWGARRYGLQAAGRVRSRGSRPIRRRRPPRGSPRPRGRVLGWRISGGGSSGGGCSSRGCSGGGCSGGGYSQRRVLVEQRKRVIGARRDASRLGADHRAAAGPPPDQRKRTHVVTHEPCDGDLRELPVKPDPLDRMRVALASSCAIGNPFAS